MKRYVEEEASAAVRRVLTSASIATSRLSEVEVASALCRRCHEGTLSRRERDRALVALRADIASLYVVELTPEIAQASATRLTRHALRTGDAVQLASCAYLRDQLAGDVQLLAYDTRLNQAARAERIALLVLP